MIEMQRGIWSGALYYAAFILDETTLMPFATVVVIGGGIWWLGRKLQSLEDGQEHINRRLNSLPCDRVIRCITENDRIKTKS